MQSSITLKIAQQGLGSDLLCLTPLREPEQHGSCSATSVKLDAIQFRDQDAIPIPFGGDLEAYRLMQSIWTFLGAPILLQRKI